MPSSRLMENAIDHIDRARIHRRSAARWNDFNDPNVEPQYPPDLELEPVHLTIDLHVDMENERAAGSVTITVVARRDAASALTLQAIDLGDVQVEDADGHSLRWHYDGNRIQITWDEPLQAREERRVTVRYSVEQPADGLFFSSPDAAYPQQPRYATTDHETERARHWLPCVDFPTVRTTLDLYLRADARFTIVANGRLIDEMVHGVGEDGGGENSNDEYAGTKTAHWRLDQRCPSYLICFAIGDFTVAEDGAFDDGEKSIPCAYFCSPEHSAADLLRTFGRTRDMLAWMTQKLDAPFPYPKYYQYALPGIGGAMENISLVSWDERYVQDETLAPELGWRIDQINVHEMAHSYFGDDIVCRDFAHAWLKESWATYIEQLWREDRYSEDEALYVYHLNARDYLDEADNGYQRPIVTRRFRSSWDMYDSHLYEGGACRLHTLRRELGDDIFFAAVRDYVSRYSGEVVETDDFRRVLESHSGRSLGQFFDQWFHSPGYPDIKVKFTYDEDQGRGTFEIEQRQADGDKGIPVFKLSTAVSWMDEGGEEHVVPVELEQAKQFVTASMPARPRCVRFDPHCQALHKLSFNPGDDLLRYQLRHAPDVIGRILAAEELVKTGKRGNLRAVVEAYADEPFWGVRRSMVEALGEANHEVAIAGLVQCMDSEGDPMVLGTLFRAASNYRDERIGQAIAARLEGELPPMARGEALAALGAQRTNAPFDTLLAASQEPSFNGFVQAGALSGLAATRRNEAVAPLLERTAYGATDHYARSAAVTALADIGQGLEKRAREEVIERLVDLLRDPWWRVERAAARGLRTLRATEAIDALEALSHRVTHADRVSIERIISAIRKDDKEDGSALKKEVKDLRDQVRKLQDQLQKLAAKVEAE